MERWHLPTVAASGKRDPQVLFSGAGARGVVIDLRAGEEMGEHSVKERAIIQVVSGTVDIQAGGGTTSCEVGTLVVFAPGERHAVRATTEARLLMVLAPWPAADHYRDDRHHDASQMPANATAPPL
jgi:quercetin dioxygenase-like cupin family protein